MWKRHARFSRNGTWNEVLAAVIAHADAAGDIDGAVSADSTVNRAHQHATNLPRAEIRTGASATYMSPFLGAASKALFEPPDHGIGRSRGGLSTKVHHAVDGRGRPLSIIVGATAGRHPRGPVRTRRPRARPTAVLGDRACSSTAIRAHLRSRGIAAVISEPRDRQGHGARRGSAGGRPLSYDRELHQKPNVVAGSFALLEQWRGLATRYDKHPLIYREAVVLAAVLARART